MGESLARKPDQSGKFSYYSLLMFGYFKSDDDETGQEYTMGGNLLKLKRIFDDVVFNSKL